MTLLIQLLASVAFAASGLAVGTPAPDFTAKTQDGKEVKLSEQRGKFVLLYFYPKDDTPGCTTQACQIRDEFGEFKKAGITVYGVSRQSAESHREFKKKHQLPFELLVDTEGELGDKFNISSYPLIGIYKRQSVLIDPEGKIAKFMDSVDPKTHAAEILKAAQEASNRHRQKAS